MVSHLLFILISASVLAVSLTFRKTELLTLKLLFHYRDTCYAVSHPGSRMWLTEAISTFVLRDGLYINITVLDGDLPHGLTTAKSYIEVNSSAHSQITLLFRTLRDLFPGFVLGKKTTTTRYSISFLENRE